MCSNKNKAEKKDDGGVEVEVKVVRKTIAIRELMDLGINLDDMELSDEEIETNPQEAIINQMKKDVLIAESEIVKKGVMLKKTYAK